MRMGAPPVCRPTAVYVVRLASEAGRPPQALGAETRLRGRCCAGRGIGAVDRTATPPDNIKKRLRASVTRAYRREDAMISRRRLLEMGAGAALAAPGWLAAFS